MKKNRSAFTRLLAFVLILSLFASSQASYVLAGEIAEEGDPIGLSLGLSVMPFALTALPVEVICAKDTFVLEYNTLDYSSGNNRYNLSISNNLMKRSAVFEFNLSGVSPEDMRAAGNIRLSFDIKNFTLEESTVLRAYEMADQLWPVDIDSGSGLTGQIVLEKMGSAITDAYVAVNSTGQYSVDVTDYIMKKYEAGVRKVNIMLRADPTKDAYGSINITPRDTGAKYGSRLIIAEGERQLPSPEPLNAAVYYCAKDTYITGVNNTDYSTGDSQWSILLSNNSLKRSGVFEFDFSSATPRDIENMTNAILTVEARAWTLEGPTYLRAYAMDDGIWPNDADVRSGLTGAIAAGHTGQLIPGAWTYADSAGVYQFDLTEYIRGKYNSGTRKINITLKADPTVGATNGSIDLYPRNLSATKCAQIRIGYETDIPLPPLPGPQESELIPCVRDTWVVPQSEDDYSAYQYVSISDTPEKRIGVFEFSLSGIMPEDFAAIKTFSLVVQADGYSLTKPAYVYALEIDDGIWPGDFDAGSGLTGVIAMQHMGGRIPGSRKYAGGAGNLELDITSYIKAKYNAGVREISVALAVEASEGSIELVSLNRDRTRAAMLRMGTEAPPETKVITYANSKDTFVTGTNSVDNSTPAYMYNITVSNNLMKRAAVMEFDISDLRRHVIDGMTQAKLVFDLKSSSMTASGTLRAYGLPDDLWPNQIETGSGLTGAVLAQKYPLYTDPGLQSYAIPGSEISIRSIGRYEMDLTDYIRAKYEGGSTKINIMLITDYDAAKVYDAINIYARNESKDKCARLSIATTSPPPVDGKYPLDIPAGLNTDTLTTTRYNKWLVNLHLTTPEQILAGYKGGEGWQAVWNMAISPTNTNKLIFGTDTTGLFKSEDGGYNWRPITNNFNAISGMDVAFDPDDDNILYAIGGSMGPDATSIIPYATGVYRSTNGGASWQLVYNTKITKLFNSGLLAFAKDGSGRKTMFVGTQLDGLVRSADGINFSKVSNFPSSGVINGVYASGARVIAATEGRGLIVSEDGGATWSERNTGIPSSGGGLSALSVTVNPVDDRHWVAVAGGGLYESRDAGRSWAKIASADAPMKNSADARLHRVMFSAAPGNRTPYLFLFYNYLADNFRVSRDYGATWERTSYDTQLGYMRYSVGYYSEGIVLDPRNPDNLWVAHNGEIYRSSDGAGTFTPSSSGYSGAIVKTAAFNPDDPQDVILGAVDFGMSRSLPSSELPESQKGKYPIFNYITDRSVPEYALNLPLNKAFYNGNRSTHGIAVDPGDRNHIFASVGDWYTSCILESTDGGYNWKTRTGIVNNASAGMLLAYHAKDSNFIYAGQYCSEDNGVTWKKLSYTIHAVSPADNDVVFSKTGGRIYISRNRGKNWTQINQKFDYQESYFFNGVQVITPDMEDLNVLWVGRWGGPPVRVTLDPETNRVINYIEYGAAHGFIPDASGKVIMWCIAQNPKNPNHLVAGGVNNYNMVPNPCFYESYDRGNTWHPVVGMDGTRDVQKMNFHPTLPQLWIFTSAGIWVYEYENYAYSPSGGEGDGSGSDGSSDIPDSERITISDSDVPLDLTPVSLYWYERLEIGRLAAAARDNGVSYVRTSRTSSAGIRKNALQGMAGLTYYHDTIQGNSVKVRITIPDPSKATGDILLTGYVDGKRVDRTKAIFNKWFLNPVQVISLEQLAGFGQPVNISAQVNLSGMDAYNLVLYSYNPIASVYTRIPSPNYWVDANGYLRFTTELGGDIIISADALIRRQ